MVNVSLQRVILSWQDMACPASEWYWELSTWISVFYKTFLQVDWREDCKIVHEFVFPFFDAFSSLFSLGDHFSQWDWDWNLNQFEWKFHENLKLKKHAIDNTKTKNLLI